MNKVVICFGEVMLRLTPQNNLRLLQTNSFNLNLSGAEANVSVLLANLGIDTSYVTILPENTMGQYAINELRKYGVSTDLIKRSGERIGIYYLEKGASQRPSKVIYDRKSSSFSQAKKDDFDWDVILKNTKWLHFSGITPALSDSVCELTKEVCCKAKEHGVTISCDINYRKNLWDSKKSNEVMGFLMKYVDTCICNEEEAEIVFGIRAQNSNIKKGIIVNEDYKGIAFQLLNKFNLKMVAITLRKSISASKNDWSAILYNGENFYTSKNYSIDVIDRVGGGDAFSGGLIYSILSGYDLGYAVEFAVAASCLKHSIEGDFNHVTLEEIESLLNGDISGRIQR